jgi:hypothetical protein
MAGIAAAIVLVLAVGYFGYTKVSGGSDSSAAPGTSAGPLANLANLGDRGAVAVVVAKADMLNLAKAEETFFTDNQKYLALEPTTGVALLGNTQVNLSPQDTASVVLNQTGSGFCDLVTTTSPTTGARSTVVYVSTQGGLMPPSYTACPKNF